MCIYRYILLFIMCKNININKKADRHCSIGLKLKCSFKSPDLWCRRYIWILNMQTVHRRWLPRRTGSEPPDSPIL